MHALIIHMRGIENNLKRLNYFQSKLSLFDNHNYASQKKTNFEAFPWTSLP